MSKDLQFDPATIRELAQILRDSDLTEIEHASGGSPCRCGARCRARNSGGNRACRHGWRR
jgi:hypothetical protein